MDINNYRLNNVWAGQLTLALKEIEHSPDKKVYQTDGGIRALTEAEANIIEHSKKIPWQDQPQAVALIVQALNLSSQQSEIAQIFAQVVKRYAPKSVLDRERLQRTAEIEGFGYKKANLDQIHELCQENYGPYRVEVPDYVGLSSHDIQGWLREDGFDLGQRWKDVMVWHFFDDANRKQVMDSKTFSQSFLDDGTWVRQDLARSFGQLLPQAETLLNGHAESWGLLRDLTDAEERLMVRSSGVNEDTEKFSNAGGNTSVPNVQPSTQEVLRNTESVVSSYIDEQSLKQRLGAADESVFEPVMLTPVILQRMIGERDPNHLLSCGVMFSEDCESRVGGEKKGTTGITVIQSAHGHNTAVVESLIPVDTHYVTADGLCVVVARPKTHRMVPSEQSSELNMVTNPPSVANQVSLPMDAVRTLKAMATRFEQFYGGPVDVEFVVDHQIKTIYVVQVRPLVNRERTIDASYIADMDALEAFKSIKGNAIVTAGGGLHIMQPAEVIALPSLSQAYKAFQKHDNPKTVKAVVVGTMSATTTSHWATIFRNAGIPVIYVNDLPKVQTWIANPNNHILISPQQGIVMNLQDQNAPTLESLQASGTIAKGWVDYPAPDLITINGVGEPLTMEAIIDLYPSLRNPERRKEFESMGGAVRMEEVLERLSTAQDKALETCLALVLFAFERTLKSDLSDPDENQRVDALKRQALALAKNIKANGHWPIDHENYTRKLLPIHFLRALVYAQPEVDAVIGGDSLASALRNQREEQVIAAALKQQGCELKHPLSLTLLRLGKYALTPKVAELYRSTIIQLDAEGRDDLIVGLAKLEKKLDRLDMLVSWLNLVFPANPDVAALLKDQALQEPLLAQVTNQHKQISSMNVSAFAFTKTFDTQWGSLQTFLRDAVPSMFSHFKQADATGQFAVLALMHKTVDQFDLAIKALEGSSDFSLDDKLALFKKMVMAYHELAKRWVDTFDLPDSDKTSMHRRLWEIRQVAAFKELGAEDFEFSKSFDLIAFGTLDGENSSYIVGPYTLEDAFSATHQLALEALAYLQQGMRHVSVPVPAYMHQITERINFGRPAGYELNAKGLKAFYSKPLESHGVQYRLFQRIGEEKATLHGRFTAQNEVGRWDRIAAYMLTLQTMGKCDISDIELTPGGVGFVFHLDETDDLNAIGDVLAKMEAFSTGTARHTGIKLDPHKVQNRRQAMPTSMGHQAIAERFEALLGFVKMFAEKEACQAILASVEEDPSYATRILDRAWLLPDMWIMDREEEEDLEGFNLPTSTFINIRNRWLTRESTSDFINRVLPLTLAKKGLFLPSIAQRGLELCRSRAGQLGWALLNAVAQQNPALLPEECVFDAVLTLAYDVNQTDAAAVVQALQGRGAEYFNTKLVAYMRAKNGLVMDIVKSVQKLPEYHTLELARELGKLSEDESVNFLTRFDLMGYTYYAHLDDEPSK